MKKMKLKIKSLWMCCILVGTSLVSSSCEDFLDRQEDEKMTFDKIWLSRNTTKQYWLNSMSFLPRYSNSYVATVKPTWVLRMNVPLPTTVLIAG